MQLITFTVTMLHSPLKRECKKQLSGKRKESYNPLQIQKMYDPKASTISKRTERLNHRHRPKIFIRSDPKLTDLQQDVHIFFYKFLKPLRHAF